MIASLQRRVPNREAKVVTNSVTNRMGNRGQSRAMKSLLLGKRGQWRGTEGNASRAIFLAAIAVQSKNQAAWE
jgi:hypothetical protein